MAKENNLFDKIVPIYSIFFNRQVNYYEDVLDKVKKDIDLTKHNNILDIGCGTGAFCEIIYNKGLDTTGVDSSSGMINQAKKILKGKDIKLIHINPDKELPFKDKSFDIVVASYVAHELKEDERKRLYREMSRLAKELVIIHDYNENRAILTTIIEWLENGDYFNFIKVAKDEMKEYFKEVNIVDVSTRAAWYICKVM